MEPTTTTRAKLVCFIANNVAAFMKNVSLIVYPLVFCLAFAMGKAAVAKEELSATKKSPIKTPTLANGNPDLTGVWHNNEMGFVNPTIDEKGSVVCILCPPKPGAKTQSVLPPRPNPGRPKYKPEFIAKVKELNDRQVEFDPALRCGNPGLPRIGPPEGIVQHPNFITFLYNDLNGAFFRMIPTDGRGHNPNAEESFLGDSVGKWEGDTLVIESLNFNEETWLIDDGAFHTKDLKVTETLRRIGDTIQYRAVAEDPAVLAEPWQVGERTLVLSDQPMYEPLPCVEQDLDHVIDGTHHDNAR
jgi:hypothetical protein